MSKNWVLKLGYIQWCYKLKLGLKVEEPSIVLLILVSFQHFCKLPLMDIVECGCCIAFPLNARRFCFMCPKFKLWFNHQCDKLEIGAMEFGFLFEVKGIKTCKWFVTSCILWSMQSFNMLWGLFFKGVTLRKLVMRVVKWTILISGLEQL